MSILIKKATRKKIKEIAKLMLKEFKKPPFNEKASLNAVLNSLNFYFKIGQVLVAINNKKIIGVVIFKIEQYWEGPVIIIEDLAVKDEFKKQEVGKILLGEVENYAKKDKVKIITLKTNKKASAIKFYQKFGYKPRKDIIELEKKVK